MTKGLVTKSKLVAIADAVRAKLGTTEKYTVNTLPAAIESIKTGGGSSCPDLGYDEKYWLPSETTTHVLWNDDHTRNLGNFYSIRLRIDASVMDPLDNKWLIYYSGTAHTLYYEWGHINGYEGEFERIPGTGLLGGQYASERTNYKYWTSNSSANYLVDYSKAPLLGDDNLVLWIHVPEAAGKTIYARGCYNATAIFRGRVASEANGTKTAGNVYYCTDVDKYRIWTGLAWEDYLDEYPTINEDDIYSVRAGAVMPTAVNVVESARIMSVSWDYPTVYYTSSGRLFNTTECKVWKTTATSSLDTAKYVWGGFGSYSDNMEYLDWSTTPIPTSGTTIFASLCNGMFALKTFKMPRYNTPSTCTSLATLFYNCYQLKVIPTEISGGNKVTTVAQMFAYCRELEQVGSIPGVADVRGVDLSALTTITSMFQGCHRLKEIWFGQASPAASASVALITSNVCNDCFNLEHIYYKASDGTVADFKFRGKPTSTNAVTMFADCHMLESVDITGMDMSVMTTGYTNMFLNCFKLKSFNGIGGNTLSGPGVPAKAATSAATMFSGCVSIENLDMTKWFNNCTTVTTTASMFYGCRSLNAVDFTGALTFEKVTTIATMFYHCTMLKSVVMNAKATQALVTTWNQLFYGCASLTSLTMKNWNFSAKVTASSSSADIFRYCYLLKDVDFTGTTLPKLAISFSDSPLLTEQSVRNIFNALPTAGSTLKITLHATTKAMLQGLSDYDTIVAGLTTKKWAIA